MGKFKNFRFSIWALFILIHGGSFASSLKGVFKPAPAKKNIYLFLYQGDMLVFQDSVPIKSGKFSFQPKEKSFPRGLYRVGFSAEQSALVILSSEDVTLELDGKNWEKYIVKNSRENQEFSKYRELNSRLNFEMRVLEEKYKSMMPMAQTDRAGFEKGLAGLRQKADSMMKDQQNILAELVTKSDGLFAQKIFRLAITDNVASAEEMIRKADLEDPENLRTDVWTNRIATCFQKFGENDGDTWVAIGDKIINQTQPGSLARQVVYRAVSKGLQPLDQSGYTAAYEVAKRYQSEFPGAQADEFMKQFPPGPPSVGELAPDIVMEDRSGKMMKLSSLRGKVVLLDFWASWCGPCRHENPTVVKAYKRFEQKGFTVFSVSLDQNREKWLAAIEKDGLTWENHVSDLKGWGSAGSALYKVSGIPATFLLDKNGKIVAKNLRGQALEDKLLELLGP
jgi:thiol-disulfide isomerase/thioredoxin